MTRPIGNNYRALILGAFDNKFHTTLKDVTDHLKTHDAYISDASARRMIQKMVREGLLMEIGRGDKNKAIWTKVMFQKFAMFKDINGELVSMRKFIHSVAKLESQVISDEALSAIKDSMLGVLASSYKEPYLTKSIEVPDPQELRAELNAIAGVLSKWYLFIRTYLDSPIWDETSRERIATEFKSTCVEEHAAIVDRA